MASAMERLGSGKTLSRRVAAFKSEMPSRAWMVIELVSGLGIGAAVGYGLDVLFGTLPVFLVGLTLLGFVAGVRVMLRTAKELQDKNAAAMAARNEGDKDGGRS